MCRKVKVLAELKQIALNQLIEKGVFFEKDDWYQWYFLACIQSGGYPFEFRMAEDAAISEYYSHIRAASA
jgi:hypothetical protein